MKPFIKYLFISIVFLISQTVATKAETRKNAKSKDNQTLSTLTSDFEQAQPFFNSLAAVCIKKKWGMIDTTGYEKIPIRFDQIQYSMYPKEWIVRKGKKFGVIDSLGHSIIPTIYQSIQTINKEGLYIVSDKNKYGVVNKNGKIIIPVSFDEIRSPYRFAIADLPDGFDISQLEDLSKKKPLICGLGYCPKTYKTSDGRLMEDDDILLLNEYNKKQKKFIPRSYHPFLSFFHFKIAYDFTVRLGKKWGMFDLNGKQVLTTQYDFIATPHQKNPPKNTLIAVGKDRKFGVYDRKGTQIIPIRYDSVVIERRNGDSTQMRIKTLINNKWILFDQNGKQLTTKSYTDIYITSYSMDSTIYIQENGKTGLLKFTGEVIFKPEYAFFEQLENGNFLLDKKEYDNDYLLADPNGKIITHFPYTQVIPLFGYKGKIFKVENYIPRSGGIVDQKGNIIIQRYGYFLKEAPNHLFIAGSRGVIDWSDTTILPPIYNSVEHLDGSNLIQFADNKGCIGLLNEKTKKIVTNPKYNWISFFENGLAVVNNMDNKFGLINADGKEIIPLQYDNISFSDYNTAIVTKLGKFYGLMDRTGKECLPPKYNFIYIYAQSNCQTAIITLNQKRGIVDSLLHFIVPAEYDQIDPIGPFFNVRKNGKWGLLNHFGKMIIDCKYDDSAQQLNNKILYFQRDSTDKKTRDYFTTDGRPFHFKHHYDEVIRTWEKTNYRVRIGNKEGEIDQNENEIIPVRFDEIIPWGSGYNMVSKNGKWGLFVNGKLVVSSQVKFKKIEISNLIYNNSPSTFFTRIHVSDKEYVPCLFNNKWFYINKKGEVLHITRQ